MSAPPAAGITGSGALANFKFAFFDHNNEQTLNAVFAFGGTHEQAAQALLNAGFKHWTLGIHRGDEFRLRARGPNSTHFTITDVTLDPNSNVPTTHGDMHAGEYYPGLKHTFHDFFKIY